jgi:hypothetical protein
MMHYELEVQNLEYYIKKGDYEDDVYFTKRSEYFIREFDIVKIKKNNKIILKISYFNKCVGDMKGFHIIQYDESNKILSEYVYDDLYFSEDDKIKLNIRTDELSIHSITKYGRIGGGLTQRFLDCNIENSTIDFYSNIDNEKNKITIKIDDIEYDTEIKYTYVGVNEQFKDKEVESYYNYCCQGQDD